MEVVEIIHVLILQNISKLKHFVIHTPACSQANPHSSGYVADMKPVMQISFQILCWVRHSLMNTWIMMIPSQ